MRHKGCFITVEGQDGSGKSTNLPVIAETLRNEGINVVETREPGGTTLGEALREIVLNGAEFEISDFAELLMIFAARAQHIVKVIQPALDEGKWVLCDRFTDATYAYQGAARGVSFDAIGSLEQLVQGDLRPDLTILFDVPIDVGVARASQERHPDRFESESTLFKQKVRAAYLQLAQKYPERIIVINADQTPELVETDVVAAISGFIARENN